MRVFIREPKHGAFDPQAGQATEAKATTPPPPPPPMNAPKPEEKVPEVSEQPAAAANQKIEPMEEVMVEKEGR